MIYKNRLKKLQKLISNPILIKKPENLFYLTGQSFMKGWLLVKRNDFIFFGDGLERVNGFKIVDQMKNIWKYVRPKSRLFIEDIFTYAEGKFLKNKIANVRLTSARSTVDFQRTIKESNELRKLKKAYFITAKVWQEVKAVLKKQTFTEKSLAKLIVSLGLKAGASGVSFDPIVACGANAAVPHHRPAEKKLHPRQSIVIDFGFKYGGYCSDFTRTIFLKVVPPNMALVYRQVEKAYITCFKTVRAGLDCRDLYKLAVKVLDEKKLARFFTHNLGHGTGLEIHELPNLSPLSSDKFENGMVFSIEPGVYLPKIGGVRVEDLVYLSSGVARRFTDIPTDLNSNIIK